VLVHADLRWPLRTGIGVVQAELLRRTPPGVEILDLGVSARIGTPLSPVLLARSLARHAQSGDVFWSPGFMPPAWSAPPVVVTLHDLNHMHYYSKVHALYYELVMKPLYRRCSAIICVSDFTRDELLSWSGANPEQVFTVYNGVAVDTFAQGSRCELGFPYVLYVGNRRRYKNLERLFQAFAITSLPRDGIRLVLTGEPDAQLQRLAADCNIAQRVQFAGNLTDEELARLYRGARLVAFVSLYEGFGLPILEAMAASVPVLTSNVTAMPEIAGNAALTVNPTSIEEIAAGLERLSADEALRMQLIQRGRLRATRFDWDTTAQSTWEIVRRLQRHAHSNAA
jgi:glycosyltransferase involved in cell wall biosynthesis